MMRNHQNQKVKWFKIPAFILDEFEIRSRLGGASVQELGSALYMALRYNDGDSVPAYSCEDSGKAEYVNDLYGLFQENIDTAEAAYRKQSEGGRKSAQKRWGNTKQRGRFDMLFFEEDETNDKPNEAEPEQEVRIPDGFKNIECQEEEPAEDPEAKRLMHEQMIEQARKLSIW